MRPSIFVSTHPFGEADPKPLELLRESGYDFTLNPLGRKLTSQELAHFIRGHDALIAGTENITPRALENADRLKLVSRVGIGLDSVPLEECRKAGVAVSYTPDAPSDAVAELTLGLMLDLCRGITLADRNTRAGKWSRVMGLRLNRIEIGLIGLGRIGKKVVNLLSGFSPKSILCNDIAPDLAWGEKAGITWVEKDRLLERADVVSLHLPLGRATRDLIAEREFSLMKPTAYVINTSRGGIVSESALLTAVEEGRIAGAAMDVFDQEPYHGDMRLNPNILLTQHMGSCSVDCRARMEIEATEEAIRFFKEGRQAQAVPEEEYQSQRESA